MTTLRATKRGVLLTVVLWLGGLTSGYEDGSRLTEAAPGALPLDPARAALVEQAKADLARRQSAAVDAVTLIEIRSVVWPDRGLGCPRPGVGYPQVPVDGFLIRLGLGGRVFDYHQGRGRPPFLCERSG